MDGPSSPRQRGIGSTTKEDHPVWVRGKTQSVLTTVQNPFWNPAPWTPYEKFKAVTVGLTLFPVRVVTLAVFAPLQICLAKLAGLGYPLHEDRGCLYHKEPLPLWRRLMLSPIALTNRALLWALGFWCVQVTDHRKQCKHCANIIVCAPHQSLADPFVISTVFPPTPAAVAKLDVLSLPGMGAMAVAGQGIFVNRENAESRHSCKDAIALRADKSLWKGPPTLIFPEGTTTNGQVLIQFKLGAFCPGQPVQPVLLRYHWKHYNPGWCGKNSSLLMVFLRMMLQFKNSCEIEILEAYAPSEAEQKDAKLYTENVRRHMALSLRIPTTEHSYDDVFLMSGARAGQGSDFEVSQMKRLYNCSFDELKTALKRFEELDKDNSGSISCKEFSEAVHGGLLGADRDSISIEHLFSFFDTDGNGSISYREFVQGLALISKKCSSHSLVKLAFLMYDITGTGRVKKGVLRKAMDDAMGHAQESTSPAEHLLSKRQSSGELGDDEEIHFDDFSQLAQQHPEILEATLQLARAKHFLPTLGTRDDTDEKGDT